jgi:hypothetical protein
MFFMGSLAIGPVVWGGIAELTDLPTSMLIASGGLALACLFTRRWPVSGNDQLDHTPSKHWLPPEPNLTIAPHQGPVMVTVRYEVADANVKEFLRQMHTLGKSRQRDGAVSWYIFADATIVGSYVETYVINTWLDHLRQHERISKQDAEIQYRIRALLQPGSAPIITHFVKPLAT